MFLEHTILPLTNNNHVFHKANVITVYIKGSCCECCGEYLQCLQCGGSSVWAELTQPLHCLRTQILSGLNQRRLPHPHPSRERQHIKPDAHTHTSVTKTPANKLSMSLIMTGGKNIFRCIMDPFHISSLLQNCGNMSGRRIKSSIIIHPFIICSANQWRTGECESDFSISPSRGKRVHLTLLACSWSQISKVSPFWSSGRQGAIDPDTSSRTQTSFSSTDPNIRLLPAHKWKIHMAGKEGSVPKPSELPCCLLLESPSFWNSFWAQADLYVLEQSHTQIFEFGTDTIHIQTLI